MLLLVLGGSLFSMALLGATLGAAMGLTGLIILKFFAGGATDLGILAVWNQTNNFTFSAVPMFIFLGDLMVVSGLCVACAVIFFVVAAVVDSVLGLLVLPFAGFIGAGALAASLLVCRLIKLRAA